MDLFNRQIAKNLHRTPQTINNEVKRGWVKLIKQVQKKANSKEYRYYTEKYYAETDHKLVMRLIKLTAKEKLFIGLFLKLYRI